MTQLKKLFEPIRLASLELPNRIIMPAITTYYDFADNPRQAAFYAARAQGGAGLIIVGALQALYPGRRSEINRVHINHDRYIPKLREWTKTIHDNGSKAAPQLAVYGYWASRGYESTPEDVAPSEVSLPLAGLNPKLAKADFHPKPRALTIPEIHLIEDQLGDAAARAREAGFDAIELQGIGGNLFVRFITPFTNRRTDEYGGSLANRTRIVVETIANIKKKVGADFPLIYRIPGVDMVPFGLDLEEWKEVARIVEKAGANALTIMPGWHETKMPRDQMSVPPGAFVYLAEGLKQAVKIPVAAGSQINDPQLAEQILAEGKADMVTMARPLIADPELPKKAKEGRLEDIRKCTFCCNCFDSIPLSQEITCSVNAMVGREAQCVIARTDKPRKVFIIGGGPAGMEAARVAALRGHQVTLFEKNNILGGQMLVAVLPPYKDNWQSTIDYLKTQLKKLNVTVKLGTECTVATVEKGRPDAVIIATGSVHCLPGIPGINGRNVATATGVLTGRKKTGQNVVIIGGGLVGCETAEFLHERSKHIVILEMLPQIGANIGGRSRGLVIERLVTASIRMETGVRVEEITEKGVWISRHGISRELFEADSVVIAAGMLSFDPMGGELEDKTAKVCRAGDCVQPRRIKEAIEEGFLAALQI